MNKWWVMLYRATLSGSPWPAPMLNLKVLDIALPTSQYAVPSRVKALIIFGKFELGKRYDKMECTVSGKIESKADLISKKIKTGFLQLVDVFKYSASNNVFILAYEMDECF